MDPTPSVGGRVLAHRAGRRDNRRLEARADVRTFTTAPVEEPVELLGGARVQLFLTSDNPYADVFLRLCDVDPRGRSVDVTDRLVRLPPAPGEGPPAGGGGARGAPPPPPPPPLARAPTPPPAPPA